MRFRILTLQDLFFLSAAVRLTELALSEQAITDDDLQRRAACVIGAVTCSVSFLECLVNGLFESSRDHPKPTKFHAALASVWSEAFDRQPILAKFQISLALARREPFSKDAEPYQSADALIELRNSIAHPKETTSSDKAQQRLEKRLAGKYAFGKPIAYKDEFFPDRCLTPACAKWSVSAAAKFALEFHRRLPPTAYLLPNAASVKEVLNLVGSLKVP